MTGGVAAPFGVKVVQTKDGQTSGRVVGRGFACPLDGCHGWRLSVRWPDGQLTRPCTAGMVSLDPDTMRMGS